MSSEYPDLVIKAFKDNLLTLTSVSYIGILFLFLNLFIFYFWLHFVFIAACGLSHCGERGLLFVVVHELLIALASLVAEHRL